MRIFNQFVETFSVNDLAERVRETAGSLGLKVTLQNLPNPRTEAEEHYYNPAHTGLFELGLEPHPLNSDVLAGMLAQVGRHRSAIREDLIFPSVQWQQRRSNS
jgi:UDP-sulfoquinovose synthase